MTIDEFIEKLRKFPGSTEITAGNEWSQAEPYLGQNFDLVTGDMSIIIMNDAEPID